MYYFNNKLFLIPDAIFSLCLNGRKHYFILEMDRGTISEKHMMARYQDYYAWWRQNKHIDKKDANSIRILTVTVGNRRMKNLIKACYQVKARKSGSALFWFTTTEAIDISKPQSLLAHIWLKAVPNDSRLYSLLD